MNTTDMYSQAKIQSLNHPHLGSNRIKHEKLLRCVSLKKKKKNGILNVNNCIILILMDNGQHPNQMDHELPDDQAVPSQPG